MSVLTVVLPAYNEEEAIGGTIESVLEAKEEIIKTGELDDLELIVVSDGSWDRTSEIAGSYKEVKLISYEKNRGYGGALKTGFAAGKGDIMGFMDADGTCDPLTFGKQAKKMKETNADIVIGSRIHPASQMPKTRRLGNRIFAGLLSIISYQKVSDSASGMRIFKKELLPTFQALPDGLHFTPAMSTMAVLDPDLKIEEVIMPYAERQGESKLGVVKDGLRFLNIIIETALTYVPFRFVGTLGLILFFLGIFLGIKPVMFYTENWSLNIGQIYRIMATIVCIIGGLNIMLVSLICANLVCVIRRQNYLNDGLIRKFLNRHFAPLLLPLSCIFIIGAIVLNWNGVIQWFNTGQIHEHWGYIVTGSFLILLALLFFAYAVLLKVVKHLDHFIKAKEQRK